MVLRSEDESEFSNYQLIMKKSQGDQRNIDLRYVPMNRNKKSNGQDYEVVSDCVKSNTFHLILDVCMNCIGIDPNLFNFYIKFDPNKSVNELSCIYKCKYVGTIMINENDFGLDSNSQLKLIMINM
jgi:hypothetical protein